VYEEAVNSLQRMQDFDTKTLPRKEELGAVYSFQSAVDPANELIGIYKQIPVEVLEALSLPLLTTVRDQANNDVLFHPKWHFG
jgi:hypothetical protein